MIQKLLRLLILLTSIKIQLNKLKVKLLFKFYLCPILLLKYLMF